jgi:hypothetical protein
MKRRPNCNQIFDDGNVFCLNDETVLETFSSSFGSNTATQVFSLFPALRLKIVSELARMRLLFLSRY